MLNVQPASFSRASNGRLCIALDDAAFVRADVVFVDPSSRAITALLDGVQVSFGTASPEMTSSLSEEKLVQLMAPHPEGGNLVLLAPVETLH